MFWLLGGKGVRHGGCGDAAVIVQKTTIAAGGLNFDISDGWERDGEPEDYFKVFSEARAYPLGINIVFYLMTH